MVQEHLEIAVNKPFDKYLLRKIVATTKNQDACSNAYGACTFPNFAVFSSWSWSAAAIKSPGKVQKYKLLFITDG